LEIEGGTARTKTSTASHQHFEKTPAKGGQPLALSSNNLNGQLLVDMQNVNVSYGDRKVSFSSVIQHRLNYPPQGAQKY